MMYSADIAIVSAAAKSSIQKINFYTAVKMKYIFKLLIYIVVLIHSTRTENNWSFEKWIFVRKHGYATQIQYESII